MPKEFERINKDVEPKWRKFATAYKEQPKFVRRGKEVKIYPEKEPYMEEVDGKWGKRQMYVVNSNLGLIYITPTQLMEIDNLMMMRGNYTDFLQWCPT